MLSDEVILERRNGPRRLSDNDDDDEDDKGEGHVALCYHYYSILFIFIDDFSGRIE